MQRGGFPFRHRVYDAERFFIEPFPYFLGTDELCLGDLPILVNDEGYADGSGDILIDSILWVFDMIVYEIIQCALATGAGTDLSFINTVVMYELREGRFGRIRAGELQKVFRGPQSPGG